MPPFSETVNYVRVISSHYQELITDCSSKSKVPGSNVQSSSNAKPGCCTCAIATVSEPPGNHERKANDAPSVKVRHLLFDFVDYVIGSDRSDKSDKSDESDKSDKSDESDESDINNP